MDSLAKATDRLVSLASLAGLILIACSTDTAQPSPTAPGPSLSIRKAELSSGDNQADTVFATLVKALRVQVLDRGAPQQGVAINWVADQGGGSVSPARSVTDSLGVAATVWTLGPQIGLQDVEASGAFVSGSVVFAATATARPGLTIDKATRASGDGQSDTIFATLTQPFSTRVAHNGLPLPGVVVSWSSAGAPSNTVRTSTDSTGTASWTGTLGAHAGVYTVFASVPGAANSPVPFQATILPGNPVKLTIVRGDSQLGMVGATLDDGFVVQVTDAQRNLVPGAAIDWSVSPGGGVLGSARTLTRADGRAADTLTLGNDGPYAVQATLSGNVLPSASVRFTGVAATTYIQIRDVVPLFGPSYFSPSDVSVRAGTTVAWLWHGDQCAFEGPSAFWTFEYCWHSLVFEDGAAPPLLGPAYFSSWVRSFSGPPRTIRFRCAYHTRNFDGGEVGSVTVF